MQSVKVEYQEEKYDVSYFLEENCLLVVVQAVNLIDDSVIYWSKMSQEMYLEMANLVDRKIIDELESSKEADYEWED